MLTRFWLQCVISTKDRDDQGTMEPFSGIRHVQEKSTMVDGGYPDVCVQLSGNAVVFDSFSPKEKVSTLNTINNNVSRAGNSSRRFPTKFSVEVEGDVSAILSEASVDSYTVVDKQCRRKITAITRPQLGNRKTSTAASQEDTTTVSTTNVSSEGTPPPRRKRPLETMPAMPIQYRFAAQPASLQLRPFLVNAPTTVFRPRPTVILSPPTYTHPGMRPLFALSDDDDEQPQQFGIVNAPTPRPTVILDKPTFTHPGMRPLFALSDDDDEQPQQNAPTTVFRPAPRVILDKPTFTHPCMRPLFALSDDDDEQPPPRPSDRTAASPSGTMTGASQAELIAISALTQMCS